MICCCAGVVSGLFVWLGQAAGACGPGVRPGTRWALLACLSGAVVLHSRCVRGVKFIALSGEGSIALSAIGSIALSAEGSIAVCRRQCCIVCRRQYCIGQYCIVCQRQYCIVCRRQCCIVCREASRGMCGESGAPEKKILGMFGGVELSRASFLGEFPERPRGSLSGRVWEDGAAPEQVSRGGVRKASSG